MSEIKINNAAEIRSVYTLFGVSLAVFVIYLLSGSSLSEFSRPYAPPGQTLYVLSKVTALFVYILMWWQIMLGMLKKVNQTQHIILGSILFLFIIIHVTLFVTAVSIRQDELHLAMLVPDFSRGYYNIGLSMGVLAFGMIIIAMIAAVLKTQLNQFWKFGHVLVYLAFIFATLHGLMIGSDLNTGLLSYIVYGAAFSLIIVFIYKLLYGVGKE